MKILFICKNNQFRSQMAASIYNKLTGTQYADSAGTYVGSTEVPEGALIKKYFRTPEFFEFMEEQGMNIRDNRTKELSEGMIKSADVVVSMAEEPFIPPFLRTNKKVIRWEVENPPIATREVTEKIYTQINGLVEGLILSSLH